MFISYFIAVISVFSQVEKLVTGLAELARCPLWWVSPQRECAGRFLPVRWPSSSGLCQWLCQMPTAIAAFLPLELSLLLSLLFLLVNLGSRGRCDQGVRCEPSWQTPVCCSSSAPSVLQPADMLVHLTLMKW